MEKLRVKNLGPIKDFEMETNRLTVLIGPQASGKSLMMQLLYYFRDLKALAAEHYVEGRSEKEMLNFYTDTLLYMLRGTIIGLFSGPGGAKISYTTKTEKLDLKIGKQAVPLAKLKTKLLEWIDNWRDTKKLEVDMKSSSVFIPSERYLYSIFYGRKISALFESFQSLQMKKFVTLLESIRQKMLSSAYYLNFHGDGSRGNINMLERNALGGSMTVGDESRNWYWVIGETTNIMLLGGLSSGQMSSWPFFTIARDYLDVTEEHCFYFEEPETHLHPNAQVEVVKTIAYLISRGHRFVITTHSPFILYVINNLIQAHIAYDGKPPEGEFSIDPDHVAAYCMGENPHSIVDKETRLLDLDEIDDVFDDIGEYFQTMLDVAYAKRKKKK